MLFKVAEQVVDRLLGDLELVGKQVPVIIRPPGNATLVS
jgi:hypothetical protein